MESDWISGRTANALSTCIENCRHRRGVGLATEANPDPQIVSSNELPSFNTVSVAATRARCSWRCRSETSAIAAHVPAVSNANSKIHSRRHALDFKI